MAIYLLFTLLCALVAALLFVCARATFAFVRGRVALRSFQVSLSNPTARPGESVTVTAEIHPRRSREVSATATLRCTLFDERARSLLARTVPLVRAAERNQRWVAEIALPPNALRTGLVGDAVASIFSEHARRWLLFWSVDVIVRDERGSVLARRTLALDVPDGRALEANANAMRAVIADTVSSMRDDIVFNWLARLAARDGEVAPEEREFLREILATTAGIHDPGAADARIDAEVLRQVDVDPTLLRRHLSRSARVEFYRLLHAIAWRDGTLDPREQSFLVESMRSLGLERHDVDELARGVVVGLARVEMR